MQTKIGTQPIQRKSRLLLPNIGIQIVMGVLQPPAQDMYWYKDKLKIIKIKMLLITLTKQINIT